MRIGLRGGTREENEYNRARPPAVQVCVWKVAGAVCSGQWWVVRACVCRWCAWWQVAAGGRGVVVCCAWYVHRRCSVHPPWRG